MIPGLGLIHRPDALLLDAGDTLIFFDGQAVADILLSQGVAIAPERLEAALHPAKLGYERHLVAGRTHEDGWSGLVHDLLVHAGLSSERARSVLPALRRAHDEFYLWRKVPAGLPAALDRARAAGIRLGVVSNSEGRLIPVLERVGLASYFEVMVDSALEGVQKPDPEIFRRALLRMQIEGSRAVYAGDVPRVDVLGARAAGMHGVLVDAFDHYADQRQWPRVPSVEALIDALIALPAANGQAPR